MRYIDSTEPGGVRVEHGANYEMKPAVAVLFDHGVHANVEAFYDPEKLIAAGIELVAAGTVLRARIAWMEHRAEHAGDSDHVASCTYCATDPGTGWV